MRSAPRPMAKANERCYSARRMAKKKANLKTTRSKKPGSPVVFSMLTGPKRSRRFGLAANLNFGAAGENCHWDCIYCPWHSELRTKKAKAPREFHPVPTDEILKAVQAFVKKHPKLEALILGGNTEPTSHPDFSSIVRGALEIRKAQKRKWNLVVITNGSGLGHASVREACELADQLWVKLDCAEEALFQKTNRPHREAGSLLTHLKGIEKLHSPGIQTTLWKYPERFSFQNWSADNLKALLELYREIKPRELHLTTLRRSKNFAGIQPVNYEDLEAFAMRIQELGIHVEVFP